MVEKKKVLACVTPSPGADGVADCAAWAACRLHMPLEFLHIIDRHPEQGSGEDRSGTIGLDAQAHLLEKLSAADECHARHAREQGRLFLQRLRQRAMAAGAADVDVRQRYGDWIETVVEQAREVSLLVVGRGGVDASSARCKELEPHVEGMVRALRKTPILTVTENFKTPQRAMFAFDGSATAKRGLELIASSPLLRNLTIHLLMSGQAKAKANAVKQLERAQESLLASGLEVTAAFVPGDAQHTIAQALQEQAVDLLIMGAFGHSPLRNFLFGSKTSDLLRFAQIPTLLLR